MSTVSDLFETDLAELRQRRLALEAERADLQAITEAAILAAWAAGLSGRRIAAALGLSEAHVGRLRVGRHSGRYRPGALVSNEGEP